MIFTLLLSTALGVTSTGCIALDSDKIETKHVQKVLKNAPEVAQNLVFGASPLAGSRRTVTAAELVAWARQHGAQNPEAVDACFEWPMREVPDNQLVEAMRPALPGGANIVLVERLRGQVPEGPLVFPRQGLREPAPGVASQPVLWQGFIEYAPNRRYSIWARVQLKITARQPVAVTDLKAGQPIRPEQVRTESVETFPFNDIATSNANNIIGRMPRYPVRSGSVIIESTLQVAPDVSKGELIDLEARFGNSRLRAPARAEASARIGEVLLVTNMASGRTVQAKLESKGLAVVRGGTH